MKYPLEQAGRAGDQSILCLRLAHQPREYFANPGAQGDSDNQYTRITITRFLADATARFLAQYKGVHCYSPGTGLRPLAKLLGSLGSKSRRATSDIGSAAPRRSGKAGFWDPEKHNPH